VTALIENGLMNAPVALCLAGIVLMLGRVWKQPALLHALWVLVLLKLVMPPLVQVPVPWQLPAWMHASAPSTLESQVTTTRTTGQESNSLARELAPGNPRREAASHFAISPTDGRAVSSASQISSQISTGSTATGAAADEPPGNDASGTQVSLTIGASQELPRPQSRHLSSLGESFWMLMVSEFVRMTPMLFFIALCVWGVGSVIWFSSEGWRVVQFAQVFLRHATLAPKPMQRHASNLARDMGLKHCPEVWLLSAVVSPMLWCVGGRARILFPSQLATQLDKGAMATLLTHELAHYHRGDHWVRMLEFIATGLFWWHPAVWIARREIEIHEEQCCDSWVVSQFPKAPRRYADALLATIDFLSEDHAVLPPAASGLGNAPLIRQRLILIMRGVAPKNLGLAGRMIVVAMALLVPIQPRLSFETNSVSLPKIQTAAPSQPAGFAPRPVLENQLNTPHPPVSEGTKAKSIPDSHLSKLQAPSKRASPVLAQTTSRVKQPASQNQVQGQAKQGQPKTAAVKTVPERQSAISRPDWLVWGMAKAPNLLSRVVARDNGQIFWQHLCTEDAEDLSRFDISAVAYTPEGQLFVAGCRDGKIRVWDATNGQLLKTLAGHKSDVRAVAISPRGDWLASGDQKGEVRVWSVLDERSSEILSNYCAPISSVAFSGDGKTVAVATSVWTEASRTRQHIASSGSAETNGTGLVALWNLLERVEMKHITTRHPLAVVAFSLDSSALSGAEWSGRVLTWNVGSTKLLATRFIDRKSVAAAVFSADAEVIRAKIGQTF
jgi:bla regulator protein BlaR1